LLVGERERDAADACQTDQPADGHRRPHPSRMLRRHAAYSAPNNSPSSSAIVDNVSSHLQWRTGAWQDGCGAGAAERAAQHPASRLMIMMFCV